MKRGYMTRGRGRGRAIITNDPYFDDVTLLLKGENTSGSTTLLDSSNSAQTVTNTGATNSTLDFKVGSGSIRNFNNNGTTSWSSTILAFGTRDFTMDFWINLFTSTFIWPYLLATQVYNSGSTGFYCTANGASTGWGGSGILRFNKTGSDPYDGSLSTTSPIRGAGWKHIAFTRETTTKRLFVDGILESSFVGGGIVNQTSWTTGLFNSGDYAWNKENAYVDNFRVTDGVCRWTENFTPPSTPEEYLP